MNGAFDDEFPMQQEREANMPDHCPKVSVGFGLVPMKDDVKSRDAGHDVFVDTVHVKIVVPGDRTTMYFQPATDTHKRRFPKAWSDYEKRATTHVPVEGMPIEQWAQVNRSLALTLRSMHVQTVEALSDIHDGHIDKIPQGRQLRDKARAFLQQAKDSAATMRTISENQSLRDQMAAMQAQLAALGARVQPAQPQVSEAVAQRAAAAFDDMDAGLPPVALDPEAAVRAARKQPRAAAAAR